MKTKKHEHTKFSLIRHSLFTETGSSLVKMKDTFNTHMFMDGFWLKRLNATTIDYLILLAATGIIWPTAHFAEFFVTMGTLSILYFTVAESYFGFTLGKRLFALKVADFYGTKPSLKESFTRNLSKFNPVFLILDILIGRFASKSPQKFLDKIAHTTVDISPEASLDSEENL